MRLAKAILLRLLYGVLSLLFISFVTFIAGELDPVDAARALAGEKASEAAIERYRKDLGLDRPWPERYVGFLKGAVQGDFGRSFHGTREPVNDIIRRNLPMTMRIAGMAILLAAIIGITLGTIAGIWRNRGPDRAILTLSTLGVTLPNFVLAPLLVYIFVMQMDYFPLTWEDPLRGPMLYYLVLPVVILSARPMATLTRLTRASMIDTLQQEFIRTAIAKGVPPVRLYLRHALRNAILPVVTAIGTSFGFLLTGSFVVETFFSLPGLGRETIVAIQQRNAPVVQACIFITGGMFILINLLVDMLLPILDPRIREAQV
ncbi:MAG TPA: ABC transporter permease [Fimbriimonadaceae bacterium]|nr:ABC transporter permease [Fimbriimonadaceae bacterium]